MINFREYDLLAENSCRHGCEKALLTIGKVIRGCTLYFKRNFALDTAYTRLKSGFNLCPLRLSLNLFAFLTHNAADRWVAV